jgi:hypothetical protein
MKKQIQVVSALVLFSASAAHAQQAVQWRVEDGGNGHWYRLVVAGSGLTWSEARTMSISAGGDLACLSALGAEQFVRPLLSGSICGGPSGQAGPYVGGFQDLSAADYSEPSGGWRWLDGAAFPGAASVDLDNDQGDQRFLQCISVQGACQGPFRLDDVGLQSQNRSYLMEWSADCNNDGIVDYGQIMEGSLADTNGNNVPDCCEQGDVCVASGTCAVFSRPTDTVRIGMDTSLVADYTIEWSGFPLSQPVVTNPPATYNARIWSEQNSVTEDKMIGLDPDRTPTGSVNSTCYSPISGPAPLPVIARTHVAMVRLGSTRSLYVNGNLVAQSAENCELLNGGGSNMALGAFVYVGQPLSNYWRSAPIALDWIRVSSSARYSAAFNPPTETALVSDSSTALLMKFEGSNPWRNLANLATAVTPGVGVAGATAPTISTDCDRNAIPDQAEAALPGNDVNGNGVLDRCECAVNPTLPACCPCDVVFDRAVNGIDLGVLLGQWGSVTQYTLTDFNGDGVVDGADLGQLLAAWGPCPN